jgi:predicted dehydrogenase
MHRILVAGCGSIGRRHIKNLRQLGVASIYAQDESAERLQAACDELQVQRLDGERQFDLVLVCTPPNSHVAIARKAIASGANVFMEKPISNDLDGVSQLIADARRAGRFIAVGYNMRFHRGIRMLKEAIDRGDIGKPLVFRAEVGQYLPDWRPGTDYRKGYNASVALGGGIILDASHEIDYVRWLAGDVEAVSCTAGHLSTLDIETEDAAAITMRMRSGAIAEIHLDSIQRAYSRTCKVIGEEGTLVWEYGAELRRFDPRTAKWDSTSVAADANEMYIEEMKHVLQCVEGKATPLIDGDEGRRVLEIALAAKESARTRREVSVD